MTAFSPSNVMTPSVPAETGDGSQGNNGPPLNRAHQSLSGADLIAGRQTFTARAKANETGVAHSVLSCNLFAF